MTDSSPRLVASSESCDWNTEVAHKMAFRANHANYKAQRRLLKKYQYN